MIVHGSLSAVAVVLILWWRVVSIVAVTIVIKKDDGAMNVTVLAVYNIGSHCSHSLMFLRLGHVEGTLCQGQEFSFRLGGLDEERELRQERQSCSCRRLEVATITNSSRGKILKE